MVSIKRAIFQVTGNSLAQRLLKRLVGIPQFSMGVGSGSGLESSGEKKILDMIPHKY